MIFLVLGVCLIILVGVLSVVIAHRVGYKTGYFIGYNDGIDSVVEEESVSYSVKNRLLKRKQTSGILKPDHLKVIK